MTTYYGIDDLSDYLQKERLKTKPALLALQLAEHAVRSYTRGQGFEGGVPPADVGTVMLLVAARLYDNPRAMRSTSIGAEAETSAVPGLGLTLLEQTMLNRYRRRTA